MLVEKAISDSYIYYILRDQIIPPYQYTPSI